MKNLLLLLLLPALLISCTPNNTFRDTRTSVYRELESGTVYKIEIKTKGKYYTHFLYLPRTENESERLPVLYFCGALEPDRVLFHIGVATYLDKQITQGKVQPFAVAAFNCIDYYTVFEQAFTQQIMPYLEAKFPVAADRRGRGVCGISAGGSLALYMAFQHRDTFSVVGLHSATLVGDDHDKVQDVLSTKDPAQKMRILLDVGKSDALYKAYEELLSKLTSVSTAYVYRTSEGGHTTAYWQRQLPLYIEWYGSEFKKDQQR